jgi:hypothetical protein
MREEGVSAEVVASLPRRRVAWRAIRIRARLRRRKLDEALAAGADPWTSSDLLVRAAQLTSRAMRRKLAGSIDALITLAERDRRVAASVPIPRSAVLAERDALEALAVRLRDPAPVGVAGVALLTVLLWQGTGPFYDGGQEAISDAVVRCSDRLEPTASARQ